jgi:hypothetical protein
LRAGAAKRAGTLTRSRRRVVPRATAWLLGIRRRSRRGKLATSFSRRLRRRRVAWEPARSVAAVCGGLAAVCRSLRKVLRAGCDGCRPPRRSLPTLGGLGDSGPTLGGLHRFCPRLSGRDRGGVLARPVTAIARGHPAITARRRSRRASGLQGPAGERAPGPRPAIPRRHLRRRQRRRLPHPARDLLGRIRPPGEGRWRARDSAARCPAHRRHHAPRQRHHTVGDGQVVRSRPGHNATGVWARVRRRAGGGGRCATRPVTGQQRPVT